MIQNFVLRISCSGFGFWGLVSLSDASHEQATGFGFRASDSELIHDFEFTILGIWMETTIERIARAGHGFHITYFRCRIAHFMFRVQDFGFKISGA